MESRSLRFAAAARVLGDAARREGFEVPTFRSPPRVKGRTRTIRRHRNGTATVSVVVRDRPWTAVLADMVEGFAAVNQSAPDRPSERPGVAKPVGDHPTDSAATRLERLRDLLWETLEHIDLAEIADSEQSGPTAEVHSLEPAA